MTHHVEGLKFPPNCVVSDFDQYCRYCSAFKKVKLNDQGLCNICANRKVCTTCGQRRQERFFKDGKDPCTTCEKNSSRIQIMRASVQRTFSEHDYPQMPTPWTFRLCISGLEGTIKDRLELALAQHGFVDYTYTFN
jgi:hypothetical protein